MFAGVVMVGGVVSLLVYSTVTLKDFETEFPEVSDTSQVTVFVPTGKYIPFCIWTEFIE